MTKDLEGVSLREGLMWSVAISNSSTWDSNNGSLCKDSWKYNEVKNDVNRQCGKDLKGQFIYVSTNSNEPTHLGICDIVINDQQPGNVVAPCCIVNSFITRKSVVKG
jgi:hypothetical protein